jgi:hypothetical protein
VIAAVEVPSKRQPGQQAVKAECSKLPRAGKGDDVSTAAGAADNDSKAAPSVAPPGRHPVYGDLPDPDAEIKMVNGKPFWEYINEKGEEVSIVCLPTSPQFLCFLL